MSHTKLGVDPDPSESKSPKVWFVEVIEVGACSGSVKKAGIKVHTQLKN